jgi:hypothetical protein
MAHFLSVLPLHLPVLAELSLNGWGPREVGDADDVDYFAQIAHPNVRLLGEIDSRLPSKQQMRLCMRSERRPKLEWCDERANCVA